MSQAEIRQCPLCGQDMITENQSSFCSEPCAASRDALMELRDTIRTLPLDSDDRIFFHALGFGELVDLFSVAMIRRLHTRGMRSQQEIDSQLRRVEKSIFTQFNARNVQRGRTGDGPINKEKVAVLITRLHQANAKLWRLRSRAYDTLLPETERQKAALDYLLAGRDRDILRRELDYAVDGRSVVPADRIDSRGVVAP